MQNFGEKRTNKLGEPFMGSLIFGYGNSMFRMHKTAVIYVYTIHVYLICCV